MAQTATEVDVTPEEAAWELYRRRQARKQLLPFCQYMMPEYLLNWHLERVADALERIEKGELKRLMIHMPPQHGKSLECTVLFPLWCLGRHPDWRIATTGYSDDIAMKHSRAARNFYMTMEYNMLFPPKDRNKRRYTKPKERPYAYMPKHSGHEWEVSAKGGYYAVGVEGGLTGRGMHIGIIDDPHKNREDAESVTKREKVWEWYLSTFYTRLRPGGAIILVMTRWHDDDLAGRLLKETKKGGEQWEVISLPAQCVEYDALWPEMYGAPELERIKRTLSEYEWTALYLQEPTVRGGNIFKVDRIRYHESSDEFPSVSYVRFWDLASTIKERGKSDPDYTVGALVGLTYEGEMKHLWVRDVVYGQWEAPERDREIRATAARDGEAVRIGVEAVAGYKDTALTLQEILKGIRVVVPVPVSKDKMVRAQPLEQIFEAGNVHVLKAPWNDEFYRQFAGFPKGAKKDDFVDGTSGAYGMLTERAVPTVVVERFDAMARYGGVLRDLDEGVW